jgi:hypothetical protein
VLRITTGLLFLQHGTSKYLAIPVGPMNNASPTTMSGAARELELIGGIRVAPTRSDHLDAVLELRKRTGI